jgi:hypothetical protein
MKPSRPGVKTLVGCSLLGALAALGLFDLTHETEGAAYIWLAVCPTVVALAVALIVGGTGDRRLGWGTLAWLLTFALTVGLGAAFVFGYWLLFGGTS